MGSFWPCPWLQAREQGCAYHHRSSQYSGTPNTARTVSGVVDCIMCKHKNMHSWSKNRVFLKCRVPGCTAQVIVLVVVFRFMEIIHFRLSAHFFQTPRTINSPWCSPRKCMEPLQCLLDEQSHVSWDWLCRDCICSVPVCIIHDCIISVVSRLLLGCTPYLTGDP